MTQEDATPQTEGTQRAGRWIPVLVLAVTGLSLLAGYAIKNQCTRHDWDGYQYRTSCYNDIYALYSFRGLEREPVPYVHGDGEIDQTGEAGDLEYPAGTGMFVAAVALAVRDGISFFRLTAVWLAVAGIGSASMLLLLAKDKRRVLLFAAAPSLVLYAFHNWDLLAVLLMCAGLLAYRNKLDGSAGVLLGLGAATKVFPGLLIPALMLSRRREGRRWPFEMAIGAALAFLTVNLPFALTNPVGWFLPWRFQSVRLPNFETSWYILLDHGSSAWPGTFWYGESFGRFASVLSGVLFLYGLGVLLWTYRPATPQPYAMSFMVLLLFLLTAKVYSPQFALWLLPFFALVRIKWHGFVAFTLSDAAVWFAISWFFVASETGQDEVLSMTVTQVLVGVRYAVLFWLLWMTWRAQENVAERV